MSRTIGAIGKSKFIRVKLKDILDKFNPETEIDIANYYIPLFLDKSTPKLEDIKLKNKDNEEKIEFKIL